MLLNFLDIVCAIILFLSTGLGAYTGAVSLIIGFVFFIASFISAYLLFLPLTDVLGEYISNGLILSISSIALSYLLSALLCSFLAKTLKKLIEDISGGATDRFLGFILGIIRGIAINLVVFIITIVITGHTYVNAKNIFDCIKNNPDTKYPNWVANSTSQKELRSLLDTLIIKIGEKTLKELKLPEALITKTIDNDKSDTHLEKKEDDAFKVIEK